MRIAQLAGNVEKVPPDGYGGTELVVSMITEELVARGHEVTLFATGDSTTTAELVSTCDRPLRADPDVPVRRWQAYDIRTLMTLRDMSCKFDIVHNHMGWQALPWSEWFGKPFVTTNHNPVKEYCAPIYLRYRHLPYVAISEAYKRLNYPGELNYVATIYNGIALEDFAGDGNGGEEDAADLLLFIGRVCHDKGTAEAIEIARRVGMPLLIAGKVDGADEAYFESKVKPHLDGRQVKFLGEVSYSEKIRLYRSAAAVVYPINFEEPFGLVMAESLASGTPVLAFDRGSVRELLSDGRTAVIASTVDELVERFPETRTFSRTACRIDSERFSRKSMVDGYEALFHSLIDQWRT